MSRLSKKSLVVFVAATLFGACLHFIYTLFPNPITALFSPTCESLWEHLKLLFWPYLLSMLVLTPKESAVKRAPWLLSLLLLSAAMLVLGWLYHITLGGEALGFDLSLYVLLMGAGFLLPGWLALPQVYRLSDWFLLLTAALGIAIVLFTFLPPELLLFTDLSGVRTWSALPC